MVWYCCNVTSVSRSIPDVIWLVINSPCSKSIVEVLLRPEVAVEVREIAISSLFPTDGRSEVVVEVREIVISSLFPTDGRVISENDVQIVLSVEVVVSVN